MVLGIRTAGVVFLRLVQKYDEHIRRAHTNENALILDFQSEGAG